MASYSLTCLCSAAIAFSGGLWLDPEDKTIEVKVVEKEVVLVAAAPEVSSAGTAVNVDLVIENKSDVDLVFRRKGSRYRQVRLQLVDSRGKPVPLTRFGKHIEGSRDVGSAAIGTLLIGKKLTLVLNVGRVFDLTDAGDYTLSVAMDFLQRRPQGDTITLKVQNLKFKVVDDEDR